MTSTVDRASHQPRGDAPLEPTSRSLAPLRRWYALMLLGGSLGIVTAVWQTVERIAWAKNPDAGSICEINSVLSCSSVYSHWQSSALGIPNSLIGLPVFAMLASAGLAGVLGSRLSRGYLATLFGVTIFMAGFVTWYMEQSAFSIRVLCLFCVGCAVNVVIAGIGVTRVAAAEHAFGTGRFGREMRLQVESRSDLIAWLGLAAIIAAMLLVGLA
jgi:uncharacterized membrane protein